MTRRGERRLTAEGGGVDRAGWLRTRPARGVLGRAGKRDGLRVGLWFWVLGWVCLFYFYFSLFSISNSNHTQIIKIMHQHECNTKI